MTGAMEATGIAAYCWIMADDTLTWSSNAGEVLAAAPDMISSGRRYASLIDPLSGTNRYDAIRVGGADTGGGVAFQIEYLFRPGGRGAPRSVWLEDTGRWFAGPDGRPARILGTVRQVDERHRRQQQLRFLKIGRAHV